MTWFLHQPPGGQPEQVQSETHPCDPPAPGAHPAYDWNRADVAEVPRPGDLDIEEWNGAGWVARLEPLRDRLLRAVDDRRTAAEASLSRRRAHDRKRGEVLALAADPSTPADKLPWLSAEAAATGKTIAAVAAGVRSAIEAEEAEAAAFEARAIAGKIAIRAAGTIEDVSAAFDNIDWGN